MTVRKICLLAEKHKKFQSNLHDCFHHRKKRRHRMDAYCFLHCCCYPRRIDFKDTWHTHRGTKEEEKREKTHNKKHLTHEILLFIFPLLEIKIWNMSKGQKGSSGQKLIMSVWGERKSNQNIFNRQVIRYSFNKSDESTCNNCQLTTSR